MSLYFATEYTLRKSLSKSKRNDYRRWWGRPELNRRPLPGTVIPRPYGFLLAPEFRHPRVWSANPLLFLEPLTVGTVCRYDCRHPFLAPVQRQGVARLRPHIQQQSASSKYIRFLKNKRNIKKARVWMVLRLPAIGCGTHLIPFRTQKLNHAPFPVLVWSSAT